MDGKPQKKKDKYKEGDYKIKYPVTNIDYNNRIQQSIKPDTKYDIKYKSDIKYTGKNLNDINTKQSNIKSSTKYDIQQSTKQVLKPDINIDIKPSVVDDIENITKKLNNSIQIDFSNMNKKIYSKYLEIIHNIKNSLKNIIDSENVVTNMKNAKLFNTFLSLFILVLTIACFYTFIPNKEIIFIYFKELQNKITVLIPKEINISKIINYLGENMGILLGKGIYALFLVISYITMYILQLFGVSLTYGLKVGVTEITGFLGIYTFNNPWFWGILISILLIIIIIDRSYENIQKGVSITSGHISDIGNKIKYFFTGNIFKEAESDIPKNTDNETSKDTVVKVNIKTGNATSKTDSDRTKKTESAILPVLPVSLKKGKEPLSPHSSKEGRITTLTEDSSNNSPNLGSPNIGSASSTPSLSPRSNYLELSPIKKESSPTKNVDSDSSF
jgi:hypothetical protein